MFVSALHDLVYEADVTILIGTFDEYQKYIRDLSGHETGQRRPNARVTAWERETSTGTLTEWFVWLPDTWPQPLELRQYKTLVHESRHLSDQILRSRGVQWSEESEEAFTYHQTYWFEEMLDAIEDFRNHKSAGA